MIQGKLVDIRLDHLESSPSISTGVVNHYNVNSKHGTDKQ